MLAVNLTHFLFFASLCLPAVVLAVLSDTEGNDDAFDASVCLGTISALVLCWP